MRLSAAERQELDAILAPYEQDAAVQSMAEYQQHGVVDTLSHVRNVAELCWWLAKRLHLDVDERALATGAFLHDFYLYDWHGSGWQHSFKHPGRARINARNYFDVDEKTQDVIARHMWPINISRVPNSVESALVCVADKIVSAHETLFQRREKKRLVD